MIALYEQTNGLSLSCCRNPKNGSHTAQTASSPPRRGVTCWATHSCPRVALGRPRWGACSCGS